VIGRLDWNDHPMKASPKPLQNFVFIHIKVTAAEKVEFMIDASPTNVI
jgi:hypothetical protein